MSLLQCKQNRKSNDYYSKLKQLKHNVDLLKQQTSLNNETNKKTRILLQSLKEPKLLLSQQHSLNKSDVKQTRTNLKRQEHSNRNNISKINSDLINYVKLRERYIQHANYWQQIWLFTDNPIFEFENSIGFDNPTYKYLSNKENKQEQFINAFDMNIYESILDLNQTKQASSLLSSSTSIGANNNHCELETISSPDSNDSGIHSDNHLNQHHSQMSSNSKDDDFNSEKTNSINGEDSLYSSVISSKKSCDFFSRELSSYSKLDSADESDDVIKHVEQHELPLGWIRCCDESGIYYWHKPSGTVTRKPPTQAMKPPEKKFNINEFINKDKSSLTSSSTSCSTTSSNKLNNDFDGEYEIDDNDKTNLQSELDKKNSNESSSSSSYSSKIEPIEIKTEIKRFYVRSLGWVKIDENDLTPERSSKAVNKCINDLSRGFKDINDVVARWGEGKDLFMDFEDNYLILSDPNDDNVLNKQSITSIRVWGVGRDNGRDFAYVARDKQTKIHMCHVFRCDSAPAKEIANYLRDTCRRIINEKKQTQEQTNILKRPNFLPDISNKFNVKFKSLSCNDHSDFHSSDTRKMNDFLSPSEEPKKSIRCRYLGTTLVTKPSGMETLNEAIEKIYMKALDDYKRVVLKQKKSNKTNQQQDDDEEEVNEEYDYDNMFSFNLLDINGEKDLGTHADVSISPSTISVKRINYPGDENLILDCRVRYLSFMGISIDARLSGFIMHCADNTFRCHAFLCENSSAQLCKTIEAACKLRFAKCLDAHPEGSAEANTDLNRSSARFGFLGSQLKNMFDSFRAKSLFSNNSSSMSMSNNK